ncbi:uracil-DNA glycosylase family protein [Verrucomicrobiales bacterium BCK34]|nr:uracil-DNA glycosylase family protein [Verrucomicrobiales bacterium BCK34]
MTISVEALEWDMAIANELLSATDQLLAKLEGLTFSEPVTHLYNPLIYARASHEIYLKRFGNSKKRVLMMGMNPGPWGMAQTGVPFGEIALVRDWMGVSAEVGKPENEHPKRPIVGFDCEKSEVSGKRLWGLFSEIFPKADEFFADNYVVNYCPLVWMEESGRNRTPDKLPAAEMEPVSAACDEYVAAHIRLLEPEYLVGVGAFAETALKRIAKGLDLDVTIGRILHPSPASPAANRDWAGTATKQLSELGVWK